jgi:hypothetical protein
VRRGFVSGRRAGLCNRRGTSGSSEPSWAKKSPTVAVISCAELSRTLGYSASRRANNSIWHTGSSRSSAGVRCTRKKVCNIASAVPTCSCRRSGRRRGPIRPGAGVPNVPAPTQVENSPPQSKRRCRRGSRPSDGCAATQLRRRPRSAIGAAAYRPRASSLPVNSSHSKHSGVHARERACSRSSRLLLDEPAGQTSAFLCDRALPTHPPIR